MSRSYSGNLIYIIKGRLIPSFFHFNKEINFMERADVEKLVSSIKDVDKRLGELNDFNKKIMQPSNKNTVLSKLNDEVSDLNKNIKELTKTIEVGFKELVKSIEKR